MASTPTQPLPSRAELLSMGKRVVVFANQTIAPSYEHGEGDYVSGAFPVWIRNNQDFVNCRDKIVGGVNHGGPALAQRGEASVVVEDRTLQRGFVELILGYQFGELSVEDMRQVARCNYTIVATDFLGSLLPLGRQFDLPNGSRHEAAVWSWKPGDKGQNGNCAMVEGASARWASSDCQQSHRYVCAPPRSESGTEDKSKWNQLEDRWRITTASGPWANGAATCAAEFPFDPQEGTRYVFSVPVNGFQNDKLRQANTAGLDLWLNYTDQAKEGTWVIPKIESVNTPPVADAGADRRIECGSEVVLDGSASVDADGDPLTYSWTGPFGTLTGPVATARLARGMNTITLTVQDGRGGVSTDAVAVTVRDTRRPTISVVLSPAVLTPPDGTMVKVTADVSAQDACDAEDLRIQLLSIVSSELETPASDIAGAEFGVGDLEFFLRAKGLYPNSMRVYTVTYRARDKVGHAAKGRATVVVPPEGQGGQRPVRGARK